MHRYSKAYLVASLTFALMTAGAVGAVRDAPEFDLASPNNSVSLDAPVVEHQLDVEMTVRHWVLCASRAVAEELVHAREASGEAAAKTFADLETTRSCGRLAEMQVILQEPLYEAYLQSGGSAKVYSALVNIAGAWASGFVVYGGLPDNPPR